MHIVRTEERMLPGTWSVGWLKTITWEQSVHCHYLVFVPRLKMHSYQTQKSKMCLCPNRKSISQNICMRSMSMRATTVQVCTQLCVICRLPEYQSQRVILAALSMYKMARRCQQNLKAPEALKQSVTSYLAAINSLSMLPCDKQWLSVPVKVSFRCSRCRFLSRKYTTNSMIAFRMAKTTKLI